ncbi:hypothetical protein AB0M50_05740 [Nonomuraea fuscirosea]|jgi:hypothetical protein|uniref:hypothetical protein n=1 Tax=Nonomuraea fuscirosea TaxID=1291556 RepID=UPI002DDB9C84|nr:hypothetical protein [Nonomuraea fuscirosea]WSA51129.1 hypothetical protein OIE67_44955 [Nonomuraea fuscirosea]
MNIPGSSRALKVLKVGLAVGGGVLTAAHLPALPSARMLSDQTVGFLDVCVVVLIVGLLLLVIVDKVFQYRLQRQRQDTERLTQEKVIDKINSDEGLIDFLRARTEYEIAAQGRALEDNVVSLRHGHPNSASTGNDAEAAGRSDDPSASQIAERMLVIRHQYRTGCHDCSCARCRGQRKAAVKKNGDHRKFRQTNGGL